MAKIKQFSIFDIVKVRKMISLLQSTENLSFTKHLLLFPIKILQNYLPLQLRKFTEYFVSLENDEINGMISVRAEHGNPHKWNIRHLFLNKNSYLSGRQLVDYVISKFGALGANTFCAIVKDNDEELIDLFSKGCGFRLCSHESMWKFNNIKISQLETNESTFKSFKNSDAKNVCELYNDSIYPHFRYSLAKTKTEFYDRIFQGLSSTSYFKYIAEDSNEKIKAFIEIQTTDNSNYILDIVLSNGYEDSYGEMLHFAINQIIRRNRNFSLYVVNRKYMMTSKKIEEFMKANNLEMVQNHMVLVRDFYKTILQEDRIAKPAIAFTEIKGRPAFNINTKDSL